jgi:hypothetical protein
MAGAVHALQRVQPSGRVTLLALREEAVTELDAATLLCGLPKHGKTTRARELALSHLQTFPTGRVFVHDKHEQFAPDLCALYATPDEWRAKAAAAAAEGKPFPRGASFWRCKASDVTRLVIELGEKHNRMKDVRVPMMCVYDETSLMDTSGPTHMDAIDMELFSNRRHYGVHPIYNVQRPGGVVESFFTQSTEVAIFAQPSDDWVKTLEHRLAGTKGRLEALLNAPKFKYAKWRMGEGLANS